MSALAADVMWTCGSSPPQQLPSCPGCLGLTPKAQKNLLTPLATADGWGRGGQQWGGAKQVRRWRGKQQQGWSWHGALRSDCLATPQSLCSEHQFTPGKTPAFPA